MTRNVVVVLDDKLDHVTTFRWNNRVVDVGIERCSI